MKKEKLFYIRDTIDDDISLYHKDTGDNNEYILGILRRKLKTCQELPCDVEMCFPDIGHDCLRCYLIRKIYMTIGSDNEDICGFCGNPGADKVPHPIRWPGEMSASTEFVHSDCENEECRRAHAELSDSQRESFLRDVSRFM